MKKFLLFFLVLSTGLQAQNNGLDRTRLFDTGWSFNKDANLSGQEKTAFDDSGWRKVDLPHDWSIEDLPNQDGKNVIGPFSKASVGTTSTGYTVGGTAWYRNSFTLSKAEAGKTVYLQFDGVYMNADVWVNGHHLGNHPHGYTPFYFDLTPFLQSAGQKNVIAVQVKNEKRNTRFYSGSGIYRHVWLTLVNPVHVDVWGVSITTPNVSKASAEVQIATTIRNTGKGNASVVVQTELIDAQGKVVGTAKNNALTVTDSSQANQTITIKNPQLWSIQTPSLYKAKVTLLVNNKKTDEISTAFGVRSIKIDAVNGLTINDIPVEMKGGCVHHDNGPLGAAAIDRAEERKIEILKENGYNAIRSSHYPPSPAFLAACDKLGMLVIEEVFDQWIFQKRPEDYHLYFKQWWNKDVTTMIRRDRNHPSIILWSIGNEVRDFGQRGLEPRKMIAERVRELDPSRLVTEAIVYQPDWDRDTPAAFALLDVAGYNYQLSKYENDHEKFPERIIYGSEYHPKDAFKSWQLVEKLPYVIGDFVWTAMDYLGEAAAGFSKLDSTIKTKESLGWPWFNAFCGDIDLIGNKKPQSYFRDVVWRNKPIAIAVHAPIPAGMVENISDYGWPDEQPSWTWTGAEGNPLQVRVFSRAQQVRLRLNGRVIGEQKIADSTLTAEFQVPYQPGILQAVNVINGKETDAIELKTVGEPNHIRLVADRTRIKASRNDLSYVMVEITDANGQVIPDAQIPLEFSISGVGEIAGVGSGNPTDMASFQRPARKTWKGKCLAIVRPTGKSGPITLKATATGLTPGQVVISTYN